MATIRKRTLPSGLVRWQVDFTDQAGKRRSKLFPRRKDADVYLVKVRSLVANHTPPVSGKLSAALLLLYFSGGRDTMKTRDIHRKVRLRC